MLFICYLYAIYLLFICPGTDGTILPNDSHPNVTDIVLKSLSSCVEAAICCKRRDPSMDEVVQTQDLLRSAVVHALKLYDLKQMLLSTNREHYVFKEHAGVKFHAVFHHFGKSVMQFGAPYFMDTASFEHAHISDGIATWNYTSRRITNQTKEMTSYLGKRRRTEIINNCIQSPKELNPSESIDFCFSVGGKIKGTTLLYMCNLCAIHVLFTSYLCNH